MKRLKKHLSKSKGFTLVELIVVLVILAILAAILVPTLLGYIDEAKTKKYLPNAKACLDAAQAAFVEQYAINGDIPQGTPVISGAKEESPDDSKKTFDQEMSGTQFAKNILSLAGMTGNQEPYLFIVGVGSNAREYNVVKCNPTSAYEKYTIYYGLYVETNGCKPLYFYNGEWSTINPTINNGSATDAFDKYNVIQSGPLKGLRIQYYVISNHTNKSVKGTNKNTNLWLWLKQVYLK